MSINVVIAASEAVPYAKTGGLGDVAGALPAALGKAGVNVSLFMPYYRHVAASGVRVEAMGWDVAVQCGARNLRPAIFRAAGSAVPTYFVSCDEFFDRTYLYGTPAGDYFDNIERFAFFSRVVLEACRAGGIKPDVIHCNDWQTGIIPASLRGPYSKDPFFRNTSTLFTVHNLAYQGLYNPELFSLTGLLPEQFASSGVEFWGRVNLLKAGLVYSDIINTVSKAYSREIQTPEYGCGLEGVLGAKKGDLYGVLNGVDYEEWNPRTDRLIPANYSPDDTAGKAACKKAVIKSFGLKIKAGTPVIGMISRLAGQKGFDILPEAIELLKDSKFALVIVGSGDKQYQDLVTGLAAEFPGKVGVKLAFDNGLAHLVEAGADMFLMPSRYEPCGLNQMYSLRYGTVPIVRATGGLDDTITDYAGGSGNGFKFSEYTPEALAGKIKEALAVYSDTQSWESLSRKIMHEDFSWDAAARKYLELYGLAMKKVSKI